MSPALMDDPGHERHERANVEREHDGRARGGCVARGDGGGGGALGQSGSGRRCCTTCSSCRRAASFCSRRTLRGR
jgi:hypothetical protein